MILEQNERFEINESMVPAQMAVTIEEAKETAKRIGDLRMKAGAAMKEVNTKFEVLDYEFKNKHAYNPIHHMQSRLKSMDSTFKKIKKKGWPMEFESLYKIQDMAGVRVVCNYEGDIYRIADSLLRQGDIKLLKKKDYIKHPKVSGYRSLHLVIEVPIFLSEETFHIPVEIQIRSIAMDTWASLEHELRYKNEGELPEEDELELKLCAEALAEIDGAMERLHNKAVMVNEGKDPQEGLRSELVDALLRP